MKMYKKTKIIILTGLVIIAISACNKTKQNTSRVAVLPFYNDPSFTPHWFSKNSDSLKQFHTIPDFKLINQDGDTITQQTFKNKIYVTDFFFTSCPGICPKMTNNMKVIQDAFKDDDQVCLLSHSVTPVKDSVAILKEYAVSKGVISGKWHLVTGSKNQIYNLGRNAYFVEENLGEEKTLDDFLHTENFVLIDSNKHIRGIYNGLNLTSVNQLIADIKTLEKEY